MAEGQRGEWTKCWGRETTCDSDRRCFLICERIQQKKSLKPQCLEFCDKMPSFLWEWQSSEQIAKSASTTLPLPVQSKQTVKDPVLTKSWIHREITFTVTSSMCMCWKYFSKRLSKKYHWEEILHTSILEEIGGFAHIVWNRTKQCLLCPLLFPHILAIFTPSSILGHVPPWQVRKVWVFIVRDARIPYLLGLLELPGEWEPEFLQQASLPL